MPSLHRAFRYGLGQELRYAVRSLRNAPAFSLMAILTLALGIGANTAIFSVAEAVMLRPLPYPSAGQLVSVWEMNTSRDARMSVSAANLRDYAQDSRSLEGIAGYASTARTLTGSGAPELLRGEAVTSNYLALLGAQPALGRAFVASDDHPGREQVIILSDAIWRARFGADPTVVGRRIRLNDQTHEVVGVMPPGFRALTDWNALRPAAFLVPAAYSDTQLTSRGEHEISAVARLKAGTSAEQARADLDSVSRALAKQFPDSNRDVQARVAPFLEDVTRNVRRSLFTLLGATGFLLLIACANLANLLVARAVGQHRQVALRLALGATQGRIVTHVLARGLVLGVFGGAVGLVCGVLTRDLLARLAPATMPRLDELSLNWQVLAVTSFVSIATGVLAAVLPALHVARADAATSLKVAAPTASDSRSVTRWRGALVAIQIAAALVLAVGAGLMIRSLTVVHGIPLGFDTERVLTMMVNLPPARYADPQRRLAFFTELAARVQPLPGVEAAAFANQFPMRGGWGGGLLVDDTPDSQPVEADFQAVSSDYFSTLRIPLIRGRLITDGDRAGTTPVAVVSETLARLYFRDADAIGRQIRRNPDAPFITIVGVVGDVRRDGKTAMLAPQVYFPAAQTELYPVRLAAFAVRAEGEPRALVGGIQRQVSAIDPDVPVADVRTLDEVLSAALSPRQFNLFLFTMLATVAVALAIVGVYGVVAYSAAQRTHEIAIRVSLGATRGDVVALVMGHGLRSSLIGVALGIAGALGTTRLMTGLLFGIEPTDVPTYVTMTVTLIAVALAASCLPALKAMRVTPLAALRAE